MAGELPDGTEQAEAVLAEAVQAYRLVLRERLVAAYALGSLAHGGFSPLVSDVDLALLLSDPTQPSDAETTEQTAERLRRSGSELHERLSVFWGTPAMLRGRQAGGRFPPLDRLDLIEHGRLLFGDDARGDLARPGPAELLVAGAEFALGALAGHDAVEQIRRPEVLFACGIRRVTKLVLFPARFLYTAETGLVGTNHAATEHYAASGAAPAAGLVVAALSWRVSPPDRAPAIALLGREMIPLYLDFIDDHASRLAAAGRPDLAGAFGAWRARIAQSR
jgi:hypothetical protein